MGANEGQGHKFVQVFKGGHQFLPHVKGGKIKIQEMCKFSFMECVPFYNKYRQ